MSNLGNSNNTIGLRTLAADAVQLVKDHPVAGTFGALVGLGLAVALAPEVGLVYSFLAATALVPTTSVTTAMGVELLEGGPNANSRSK